MKYLYLFLLSIFSTALTINGQNSITLQIDHRLDGADFALNNEAQQTDYVFELSRLQYYISDIAITHDGGTVTNIEDVWLLVDANGTENYGLGDHMIDNVETISFYVGVGPDVNHDDPAAWPSDHPLYPQNPSMHWGWSSGYRFVCMEGYAGPSSSNNLFQIHALGDNNYFQSEITITANADAGNIIIPLDAEYANSLNGINVSSGLIHHSTSGLSVDYLQNFSSEVFSAGVVSSLEENGFDGKLLVSPNPSEGNAQLNVDLPVGENYAINVIDLSGRSVHSMLLKTTNGLVELPVLKPGMYIIELSQDGIPLKTTRWVEK